MSATETPRTDYVDYMDTFSPSGSALREMRKHAQQLERELIVSNSRIIEQEAEIDRLRKICRHAEVMHNELHKRIQKHEHDYETAMHELARIKAEPEDTK